MMDHLCVLLADDWRIGPVFCTYVRVKDLREEKKILFLILDPMQNSRCLLNQTWENVTMGDNDTASAGVDNMNKFDFP